MTTTTNKPREYTEEEIRKQFLDHLRGLIDYWADLATPDPNDSDKKVISLRNAVSGVVFSTLVTLDGGTDLPGFVVAPCPHEDDKDYHKEKGENWYPENHEIDVKCDISGCLHELLGKTEKEKAEEKA